MTLLSIRSNCCLTVGCGFQINFIQDKKTFPIISNWNFTKQRSQSPVHMNACSHTAHTHSVVILPNYTERSKTRLEEGRASLSVLFSGWFGLALKRWSKFSFWLFNLLSGCLSARARDYTDSAFVGF